MSLTACGSGHATAGAQQTDPTPSASPTGGSETGFLTTVRAIEPDLKAHTDKEILTAGDRICTGLRATKNTQAVVRSLEDQGWPSEPATALVVAAAAQEHSLCPDQHVTVMRWIEGMDSTATPAAAG